MHPIAKVGSWIFTAVMICVMLILGGMGALYVYFELTAPLGGFIPVTATVTESTLTESTHSNVGKNSSWSGYDVQVVYEYSVDGRMYSSIPFYVGDFESNWDREHTEAIERQYAEGTATTAYYDPDQPSTSRLTAEREWVKVIALTVWTVFFLGYPMYLLVDTIRQRRQ